MRQLKLRVWDTVKKKMLKPLAISFDIQSSTMFAVSVPGRSWEPVQKYEISQGTGLMDCKGSELFEDDFVDISSILYLVFWNDQSASFILKEMSTSNTRPIQDVKLGEIIGNKFENQNLMKHYVLS